MAIIKAVSSHAPINVAIDYVCRIEKTESRLVSGIGVDPSTAREEMESTKELYRKTDGRTYKHFVQSFAPDESISPEEAHELACEFCKQCSIFDGFEVLISTHQDRDHIHTHFIVNSVNYQDGHKFQMSASDLKDMKQLSDQLCVSHGLSVCQKGMTFDGEKRTSIIAWTKEKYTFLSQIETEKSSKSYLFNIASAVKQNMAHATSISEFCQLMNQNGFTVNWQDQRKHITFSDSAGNKVRESNLNKVFNLAISKETLIQRFHENTAAHARQISLYRDSILSEYQVICLTQAKADLDQKLSMRKQMASAISTKLQTADSSLRTIRSSIKQWTFERNACSIGQPFLKHELQSKIEHGKLLAESIEQDRETFLKQYGFTSIDEVNAFFKDNALSSELSEQLTLRIEYAKNSAPAIYPMSSGECPHISLSAEEETSLVNSISEQMRSPVDTAIYQSAKQVVDERYWGSTKNDSLTHSLTESSFQISH